jgi:chaperone required for assembly of F1-ATPase
MTAWAAKRFWSKASAAPCDGGFTVHLDARPVRTPAKSPLILPTLALAEAVAAEWEAQTGLVTPATMPFTRTANSAIDKVAPQFDAVVSTIAAYGGTDLLCYRAETPEPLIARQAAGWDPILAWAATTLAAPLQATSGVMHVSQPPSSLEALTARVAAMTPFQIAAFHDLVALSGSLILALAMTRGRLDAETAWSLSRIDETWQAEVWGVDEEAAEMTVQKHDAFLLAGRFFALCG